MVLAWRSAPWSVGRERTGVTALNDTRGVLFDMDGLLLDTERLWLEVLVEILADIDIPEHRSRSLGLDLIGGSAGQSRAHLKANLPQGTDIEALVSKWIEAAHIRAAQAVPHRPTVSETLETLARQGRSMAVVTSTWTKPAREQLEAAGFLEYFVTVVGGDIVPQNKPHPAPYVMGAEAIGRAPQDCVAFEDSDRGIAAAVAAGCDAWQIPDLRPANKPFPEIGQGMANSLAEAARAARLI